MSGAEIPAAAIEAAAGAMFDSIQWHDGWDNAVILIRHILEAAAPHIEAAYLEAGWQTPEAPYVTDRPAP